MPNFDLRHFGTTTTICCNRIMLRSSQPFIFCQISMLVFFSQKIFSRLFLYCVPHFTHFQYDLTDLAVSSKLLCPANYCVQNLIMSTLCVNTCPDVPQFNLLQLYRAALGMAAFINCVRQVHIRSKMATFRKHSLTLDPIGNAFKDLLH